jgi:DNA-binding Xre family transcriptional regulator
VTAPDVIAALLAVLGAGGLGFTVGARRERAAARADVAMWCSLAKELHAENGKLRCESTPVPRSGEPPSGKPNQLCRLRARLEVSAQDLAERLGIAPADLATLEHVRFGMLELGDVERVVNALGCRLDVVAVHRLDGIAHWLSDDHLIDRLPGGES